MPVYGPEKIHHMIRSILPSTARRQAKQAKVALHQANRSRSHNQLALYKGPASYVIDMYEDDVRDLEHYEEPHNMAGWESIVEDRRAHDKLNHFVEWAFQRTAHKTPQERYPYIKTLLPDNLIGRHALSHLRDLKWPELNDYSHRYVSEDVESLLIKERANFGASPRQRDRSKFYSSKRRQELREKKKQIKEMVDAILEDKKSLKQFNELLSSNYRNQRTAFITKHVRLFESAHTALIDDQKYAGMKYDYMENIWERSDAPQLITLNHVNKYRFYPIAFAYQDVMKFVLKI